MALTYSTVPAFFAFGRTPESTAALYSIPVPIIGACALSSGTAWRCMFDPISARLASSLSRKGIIAVATETICLGDISIRSTSSLGTTITSALLLTDTFLSMNLPSSLIGSLACATRYASSSSAVIYKILSVITDVFLSTTLYGVSMNPYSLTLA